MLAFWIGVAAVITVALFIWGRRGGQFKDIEEAKYRMLEDREPEPWPDKTRKADRHDVTEEPGADRRDASGSAKGGGTGKGKEK